ncbi:hypothetical protein NUU61_001919 [Penicillium alfredii]|uniref:MmgE/PrpD family protein n=1 Tax=Penicillium alfredii TaxID=1506179 RepID=A0A9W9FR65_9EURO|nr:uncharacterized protein NUU61_001919 [Penicillium alfredii]KAJ5104572.1 hypothetical protein NUU61_001919 [Penicillium alfredii]
MATQALANWSSSLEYNALSAEIIHVAVRSFYNWTGCVVGGSAHPAITIARSALARFSGPPTSRLLGSEGSIDADAIHAALFNGIASHVHDYDDTHLDTIIHPTDGAHRLSAPGHGRCKVGRAVWPEHYDVGWHITSTTGSIGAAVAVSKLLGSSAPQTAHSIGLAATQVTGLREMFGSHTKSFHPGRAAQNGLLAAILSGEGYTSSAQVLEAKRGWANVVSSAQRLDAEVASLAPAGRWEIAQNAFKPFPCGIVVHPVIDGCVWLHGELRRQGLLLSEGEYEIQEVRVTVHPLVLELTGKTAPRNGLEAKFSVYHGGAVGLLLGRAAPAQYEDAVVVDERVVRLRERIHATAGENLRPEECHLAVSVQRSDGSTTVIEKHVDHAMGSVERPMADVQLTDKFVDQCIPVLG